MTESTITSLDISGALPGPGPASPLLSAEEFVLAHGNARVELVEGVVVEVPMPAFRHGLICANMTWFLRTYTHEHDSGQVGSNDSFILVRRNPDTVRGADVAYFSYERLPKGPVPEGLLSVAPDLVVEVRSPSDRWNEVFVKIGEYLGAGVRVVLVLDVATTTATVYREETLQQTYHAADELVLPDVLPGFAVRVEKLFV